MFTPGCGLRQRQIVGAKVGKLEFMVGVSRVRVSVRIRVTCRYSPHLRSGMISRTAV